ncbi:MAG: rod shape-determining protein MreC [Deltaproteobacteria bacterium]|nr:rod shape-determining protein MreC [Deltaproteobacteria bacterium]
MSAFLKRHQIVIVSVFLVLVSLHLALTDKKEAARGVLIKEILSAAVSPLQRGVLTIYNSGASLIDDYVYVIGVKDENDALKETVVRLGEENNRLREEILFNARLKEMLPYADAAPFQAAAARITAFSIDGWTRTIVINMGSANGIKKDMAVITPAGIVGRVMETGRGASRVLLSTDPRSNVDIIVQRTRIKGVVEGSGGASLYLKYIRQLEDVHVGDEIVTSGLSGIYPKGLMVGTVAKIEKGADNFFNVIEVKPSVDIGRRLEEVLVVTDTGDAGEE